MSYRPVLVVNWQRALCLTIFDKAEVLEYYDKAIRSSRQLHQLPAVVRVPIYLKMVRHVARLCCHVVPECLCAPAACRATPALTRVVLVLTQEAQGRIALNRRNVLIRDQFCCQYCGVRTNLTIDHVMPLSKGGRNSW